MKVFSAQMDMRENDPDYNYKHAQELIRKASLGGADVVVLPETWNTGFSPAALTEELCDKNGERTKEVIGGLAKELNINVVAGSISNLKPDGKIYNTSLTFDRKGRCIAEYDKVHAFTPAGEDKYYTKGNSTVIFDIDGHPCSVVICYDMRFCELVRTVALKKIDILFIPAQWPIARLFHWKTLALARAIENQIFVVTCNSCGTAAGTTCCGASAVIDPWGETLNSAGANEELISAELDFSVIEKIRSSINVYRDRRPEMYKL